MRCCICDTKIPLGKYDCPNCGMKMKANHVSAFDASGKGHDHIKVEVKKPTTTVNNKYSKTINNTKQTTISRPKINTKPTINKQSRNIITFFVIIMIVFSIISSAVSVMFEFIGTSFTDILNNIEFIEKDYMTIDDLNDNPEYEELSSTLFYIRNDMYNIVETYLDDVMYDEYVYVDNSVYTTIETYAFENDVMYNLMYECIDDKIDSRSLDINWSNERYSHDDPFPYKDRAIEGIAKKLGYTISMSEISNAYDDFLTGVIEENDGGFSGINIEKSVDSKDYEIIFMLDTTDYEFNYTITITFK